MTGLGVKRAMAAMVVGIAYSKSKGRELESVRAISSGDETSLWFNSGLKRRYIYHWIGLRENLQESPIFNGKIYGFL